jgi:CheY-like chemotaxis protein
VPKRIVVVDDEPLVRLLLERTLCPPEFETISFAAPKDALIKLHEIGPDLIVCDIAMPEMDGRAFLQIVKRSAQLRDVPFIFLSGIRSNDEIVAALEGGADDFVSKPFEVRRLVAKVRATLRMADRRTGGPAALSGPLSAAGSLPLLKFCEDSRLTGRLTLETAGGARWAEFLGGELLTAGPAQPGEDPLDALLAVQGGSYRIEQKPLDPAVLREAERRTLEETAPSAPAVPEGAPAVPGGRLSMAEVDGEKLQVQTEADNRPDLTITTVVIRGGQVIRKTERSWNHPLQRREDVDLARTQIDRQHQLVLETLRDVPAAEAPSAAPDPAPDPAKAASLMAWALSFIVEAARGYLGGVTAVVLLRRTHKRLSAEHPALLHFQAGENGRITSELRGPAGARELVEGVALWAAAFLAETGLKVEKTGGLSMRRVTRMIEAELERAGFYAAFDAAYVRLKGPPVTPGPPPASS